MAYISKCIAARCQDTAFWVKQLFKPPTIPFYFRTIIGSILTHIAVMVSLPDEIFLSMGMNICLSFWVVWLYLAEASTSLQCVTDQVTAGSWASLTLTWHAGCNISIWWILHMHLRWVHVCVLLYQWSQLITVKKFSRSSQLNPTQSVCLFLLTRRWLVCHFPGVQRWVN